MLKPSERDPSTSLLIADLLKKAGLPDGVFNVVHGDRVAVDTLLTHPDVAAVSFVGSTPVAEHIYRTASAHGKRVQALGGAKNHMLVMPDADPEQAANALLGASAYQHSYPHCWRSKTPIIFRTVEQFFIRIDDLRADALKAIKETNWIPEWGLKRITGTVESRPDWCISRQRSWGVPLPFFLHKDTDDLHPRTMEILDQAAINAQKQAEADVQTLVEQQKNMVAQKKSELEAKRAQWNKNLEDALGAAGGGRNIIFPVRTKAGFNPCGGRAAATERSRSLVPGDAGPLPVPRGDTGGYPQPSAIGGATS